MLPASIESCLRQSASPSRLERRGLCTLEGGLPGSEILEAESLRPDSIDPESWPEDWMLGPLAGRSLAMQHLFARVRHVVPHFRLATVEGEPGTGKLLLAQTLHCIGPAAAGPFVPCMAAEFVERPAALWQEAGAGLLWLSHIEQLTADQQRRLRDFLERSAHERMRYGPAHAPLQLVAGSMEPLRRLAAAGEFRSELASHFSAIRFALPPLRERRDDIPLLASVLLRRAVCDHGKVLRGFAPGTLARLHGYAWPGNVRELESVITAAALECPGQWLRPVDLPRFEWLARESALLPCPTGDNLATPSVLDPGVDDANLDRLILRHVTRVLARVSGNKVRAARLLGISRSTLYRLLESQSSADPARG